MTIEQWFRVVTVEGEIVLTCLKCTGAVKITAPCDIPAWERAVRMFKKDHKACAPPKNKPVRVPPKVTRYQRITKDDD